MSPTALALKETNLKEISRIIYQLKNALDQEDVVLALSSAIELTDFTRKQYSGTTADVLFRQLKNDYTFDTFELHDNIAFSEILIDALSITSQKVLSAQDEHYDGPQAKRPLTPEVKQWGYALTGMNLYIMMTDTEYYKSQVANTGNIENYDKLMNHMVAAFTKIDVALLDNLKTICDKYLRHLRLELSKNITNFEKITFLEEQNNKISPEINAFNAIYIHIRENLKSNPNPFKNHTELAYKYLAAYEMRATLLTDEYLISKLKNFCFEFNKHFHILEKSRDNYFLKIILTILALPSLIAGPSLIKKIWTVQGKTFVSNLKETLHHNIVEKEENSIKFKLTRPLEL